MQYNTNLIPVIIIYRYAIAQSLRDRQRVIYTTPIKALSNQKYREFYEEFKDVGLVTGDVTINPSASCLIMTTEVRKENFYPVVVQACNVFEFSLYISRFCVTCCIEAQK